MVIQEIFGVNHHIRAVCDRVAEAGYVAVAPALFDRTRGFPVRLHAAEEIAKARKFVAKPDWDAMMRDTDAAIKEIKSAGPSRASWASAWAARSRSSRRAGCPACRAAVGYYGGGIAPIRRREAEMSDADAFRREGRQHPDVHVDDIKTEAAAIARSTSIRAPITASIATSAAATTRKAASSRGAAPWGSSKST